MASTLTILSALFVLKCLYAWLLSRLPAQWVYPDLTWVFVAIGVSFCCAAAGIDRRFNGPYTAETYELRVWAALVVGGIPMATWQITRSVRAWMRIIGHLFPKDQPNGNTTDHASSVAAKRRGQPRDDR